MPEEPVREAVEAVLAVRPTVLEVNQGDEAIRTSIRRDLRAAEPAIRADERKRVREALSNDRVLAAGEVALIDRFDWQDDWPPITEVVEAALGGASGRFLAMHEEWMREHLRANKAEAALASLDTEQDDGGENADRMAALEAERDKSRARLTSLRASLGEEVEAAKKRAFEADGPFETQAHYFAAMRLEAILDQHREGSG